MGKRGITFTTSVERAAEIAKEFIRAGVPAAVVHSKTKDKAREQAIIDFQEGKLWQLVNVGLFGEGFDVPAVEVVSMARPTKSYSLYSQQFGRALRVIKGKSHAIIIDHVGNVIEHDGPPDIPRLWSLDPKQRKPRKKAEDDVSPMTICTNPECFKPYLSIHSHCPYCNHEHVPQGREEPEQVDGDLVMLDPEVLAKMRQDAARVLGMALVPTHLTGTPAEINIQRMHERRREAHIALKASIEMWMGYRKEEGRTSREAQKQFYYKVGVDVLSAQGLKKYNDVVELANKVNRDIGVSHSRYVEKVMS